MVSVQKKVVQQILHPHKSRREYLEAKNGPNELQLEPELEGVDERSRQKTHRPVRSYHGRSRTQGRPLSTTRQTDVAVWVDPKSNENKNKKAVMIYKNRKVVKANLQFRDPSRFDMIINFFPSFQKCCGCWKLRTGCFIIGWTQVIGCVIVGALQSFIALVCFEVVDLEDLFRKVPPKFNPAKTVSEYADDYCAGLSIGFASGEVVGFLAGIMLLVAVWKDLLYLLRVWVYVVILMVLPTITFYGIAIYAVVEYRSDVPVIAVPSTIELASFVILCYCTSIVKSYYYERLSQLFGMREPIYVQTPTEKPLQV